MLIAFKNVKDCHMEKGLHLSCIIPNYGAGPMSISYKNADFDSTHEHLYFAKVLLKKKSLL